MGRKIALVTGASGGIGGACARELAREGYTVLLSTHNPQHALTFADRVLALHNGTVAAHGTAKEVLNPELLRRLYRVEAILADTPGGSVIVPLTEEGES